MPSGTIIPVCDAAIVPEDFEGDEPTPEMMHGPTGTGELWVRGPSVVRGYWHKPEATEATFTKGWVHTGDLARMDEEGYIYIVDRAKDMIIRGGENVYSVIVEAAIFKHPAVADCAVIGVPHPTLGEEVAAVIVPREGHSIDENELRAFLKDKLAAYKIPSKIWTRTELLPRNASGKFLKREVRKEILGA